tara:strand:+ start:40 stop:1596 length:1557 start_codon:yes stop_codon:yes gene_type:complete
MAAIEPSEVYCAAALCFHTTYLKKVASDGIINLIGEFFPEAEKEAKANIVYPGNKKDILDLFADMDIIDDTYSDIGPWAGESFEVQLLPSLDGNEGKDLKQKLNDMIVGISAAIAIQKWMKDDHNINDPVADKVYLTGNKWPKKVEPLQVQAHGFDAYNSSDLIVRPVKMKNAYFGVSLKKKFGAKLADPTLINKAFDTLIKGDEFDDTRKELQEVREKYFSGLVKDAIKEGHIHIKGAASKTDKFLFSGHKPADRTSNNMAKSRAYIDTKGSLLMKEILGPKDFNTTTKLPVEKLYGLAAEDRGKYVQMLKENKPITVTNSKWNYYGDKALDKSGLASRKNDTMRGWVNKQLGKPDALYKRFMKVMNDNRELFVEKLIQVTLKKDLPDLMDTKRMGDMTFGFALVTGIGAAKGGAKMYTDKGKIVLEKGKVYDIHDVRCGLSELDADPKDYEFKIVGDDVKDDIEADGAAKVYFDLVKGKKTLMNMELRYKGGFTSQPQFFGTLAKYFTDLVSGKCP